MEKSHTIVPTKETEIHLSVTDIPSFHSRSEDKTQDDDSPPLSEDKTQPDNPTTSSGQGRVQQHRVVKGTALSLEAEPVESKLEIDSFFAAESESWMMCCSKFCSGVRRWFYEQRLNLANTLLLRLERREEHVKNWRPQILIVTKDPADGAELTRLLIVAEQLKAGKGLSMAAVLMRADCRNPQLAHKLNEMADWTAALIARVRLDCQPLPIAYKNSKSLSSVLWIAMQSAGLGSLTPNTILVQYPAEPPHTPEMFKYWFTIHCSTNLGMCLLMPKGDFPVANQQRKIRTGNIDIWWILHQGGVVLLMSFLLKKHRIWHECKLRIFAAAEEGDNQVQMKTDLEHWLYQLRISAEVQCVPFERKDIDAYACGRTMDMEQRQRLQKMLKQKMLKRRNPQDIADQCHSAQKDKTERSSSYDVPADALNAAIRDKSGDSHLVVINLPRPPTSVDDMPVYMHYLDQLTADINRVLLVRGTDTEVITYY